MRLIYKRILRLIVFLIILTIFIGVAYLFYDKVIANDTKVIVDNELSINYLDGNKISDNKSYKFSVTNNGTNDVYYNILVNNLKRYSKDLTYSLESQESKISIKSESISDNNEVLLNSVLIKAGATENFILTIKNNIDTSFVLEVKKTNDIEEYFYTTIIKNNEVKEKSITQIGDITNTNEGLIKDVDDDGITYYFRGNVDNNYVSFANNLWRIIRINGNGTVKMILNDISNDLSSYNIQNENYEGYKDINVYNSLNSYYEENLSEYDKYISNAKFCVESEKTQNNSEYTYNSYTRVAINNIPTFNCLGDKFTSKIGLITVDEVVYAGGSLTTDNKTYYLYNDKISNYWWTSSLGKSNVNDFYPFVVSSTGKIVSNISGMLNRGLRPVINLNKEVKVNGDGTLNNPYIIDND